MSAQHTDRSGRSWTTCPSLRIRCPALLCQEFNAPPIELRNTGLTEQLVEDM
jgi:hypothetical protein